MRNEIESNNAEYPIYEGCEFGDAEMKCYYDEFYAKAHPKDYDDIKNEVSTKNLANGFTVYCLDAPRIASERIHRGEGAPREGCFLHR